MDQKQRVLDLEDRLRLQELVADISTMLVNLPAEEVDDNIERALKGIVEFLGIDRSSFLEISTQTGEMAVTQTYAAPGIEPFPKMLMANAFPWITSKVLRGEIVKTESHADIPAEGVNERAYYERSGMKSQLTIPISIGGLPLCALAVASFKHFRAWPDPLIQQLKRIGELFAHSIYRQRAEQTLKSQFEFEHLISSVSARFVNTPPEDVDGEVQKALRSLLDFLGVDRCRLLRLRVVGGEAEIAEVHSAPGIPPFPQVPGYVSHFPWHFKKLLNGETISINVEELPPEADTDRRNLERIGISSHLFIPLTPVEAVNYVLTASTVAGKRSWPKEVISRVRLLGEILTAALVRKSTEMELSRSYSEIKRLKDKLEAEAEYLRSEIKTTHRYGDIVGESKVIQEVLARVEQVARTDSAVLILGETGSGKELIARAIHNLGRRKNRVMVKVDCATLPASLVESELFGREKGAYTGALTKQAGRFEIADGSTIFLDEIGELPLELQAKLLRVLQDGEFERLGSSHTVKVDVRVIAATNRDLVDGLKNRTFREDLYYRLNVFPITVPPLRDRPEDIPLLLTAFLNDFNQKMGRSIRTVSQRDVESLLRYRWPGNVRELRNIIEHAVIISEGDTLRIPPLEGLSGAEQTVMATLEEADSKHILEVLKTTGGRIKGKDGAAAILGVKPSTLYNKMKRLGIDSERKRIRS